MREGTHGGVRQCLGKCAIDGVEDADLQDGSSARGGRELGIEEAALAHLKLDRPHSAFGLRLKGVAECLNSEHRIGARVVNVGVERCWHGIGRAREVELDLTLAVESNVDRHTDWRRAGTIVVEMVLKAVSASRNLCQGGAHV